VLPARARVGARWSDACILNISSRGLMVRIGSGVAQGSVVEIRHGDRTIFARVVWCEGPRAGLQVDERLVVDDIIALAQNAMLQVTAADSLSLERRKKPQPIDDHSRQRARATEFLFILLIAIGSSAAVLSMVQHSLGHWLVPIGVVLGG
jgi:hypothetical protein